MHEGPPLSPPPSPPPTLSSIFLPSNPLPHPHFLLSFLYIPTLFFCANPTSFFFSSSFFLKFSFPAARSSSVVLFIYLFIYTDRECTKGAEDLVDSMSAAVAAAAAAASSGGRCNSSNSSSSANESGLLARQIAATQPPSRYESQKRRDWNTFGQYLRNHRPPLALNRCSGANVLEFLRYLDQFGKTKVHTQMCPFFGHPHPPAPCPCPLRQAWGSLDALIGRLRAAFEENGGAPETNPFGARAVRLYLREVRDAQAKARGIAYEKKKRKRPQQQQQQQQQQQPESSSSSDLNSSQPTAGLAVMDSSDHRGRPSMIPLSVLN